MKTKKCASDSSRPVCQGETKEAGYTEWQNVKSYNGSRQP